MVLYNPLAVTYHSHVECISTMTVGLRSDYEKSDCRDAKWSDLDSIHVVNGEGIQ